MKSRILFTDGNGSFKETEWEVPELQDHDIQVKSIFTGVCRSDIDMMNGKFGPLPLSMSGHEGLGEVVAKGSLVTDVSVGQYVATRGEPAYSDIYNVRRNEYISVPEAHPRYILEPVACGINLVYQSFSAFYDRSGPGKRLLIIGSGFLAWVAYNTIRTLKLEFDITVVGHSNPDLWHSALSNRIDGNYDVIIDLSAGTDIFKGNIFNDNALVVLGTQKEVTTNFSDMLWKSITMTFPSPRNPKFSKCMGFARQWIQDGSLQVDSFWSKAYSRNTEWQKAFIDGSQRPANYNRGYISWNQ